jgi:hypothetical protein
MYLASVQTYLEATLYLLDKHRFESPRSMPDFHPDYPQSLFDLAREIDREYGLKRRAGELGKNDYYPWRKKRLDELATERTWSPEMRNLASSVLSTVKKWERNKKRNLETQQRIEEILDGAELLFPALGIPYQLQFISYERRRHAPRSKNRPV